MASSGMNVFSHAGSCPQCHFVFPPIWEAAPTYFENGYVTYRECAKQADLWNVVSQRLLSLADLPMSLVALGASETRLEREIEAGKYHEIKLTDEGIPEDAVVLQVGYSPQGGSDGIVFPIEAHWNVPQRRIVGTLLRLIGQPATEGDGTVGTKNLVGIWVVWIHHEGHDAWPYIVQSFQEFINHHYERLIVPSQSAVEISLMPIIRELLIRHASTRHVERFMGDKLTFANAINLMLPFVCAQAGIPNLPAKSERPLINCARLGTRSLTAVWAMVLALRKRRQVCAPQCLALNT